MNVDISTAEVTMAADGTYTIQQVKYLDSGRQVERTITGAESIPAGLRALADAIEQDALRAFGGALWPG